MVGRQPNAKPMFYALVAQLDRAPDYELGGWGFESLQAHHLVGMALFCRIRSMDALLRFKLNWTSPRFRSWRMRVRVPWSVPHNAGSGLSAAFFYTLEAQLDEHPPTKRKVEGPNPSERANKGQAHALVQFLERWSSGLWQHVANVTSAQALRGFESLSFRHCSMFRHPVVGN